jgi:uncharacterized protein YciI
MAFFLCRLIPPRSDFAFTMTEEERSLMGAHAAHLKRFGESGQAVIFGPVLDPQGPWGLGIFEVSDEAELRTIIDRDPVILADRGFRYEAMAMMNAVLGARPDSARSHEQPDAGGAGDGQ